METFEISRKLLDFHKKNKKSNDDLWKEAVFLVKAPVKMMSDFAITQLAFTNLKSTMKTLQPLLNRSAFIFKSEQISYIILVFPSWDIVCN